MDTQAKQSLRWAHMMGFYHALAHYIYYPSEDEQYFLVVDISVMFLLMFCVRFLKTFCFHIFDSLWFCLLLMLLYRNLFLTVV